MFTLEDDVMIIKTPQVLEDLKSVPIVDHEQPMFKLDSIKTIKEANFFREDDFDLTKATEITDIDETQKLEVETVETPIK